MISMPDPGATLGARAHGWLRLAPSRLHRLKTGPDPHHHRPSPVHGGRQCLVFRRWHNLPDSPASRPFRGSTLQARHRVARPGPDRGRGSQHLRHVGPPPPAVQALVELRWLSALPGRTAARDRELLILRTAWNCRSEYEWGQHARIARSVDVSDDEISRVTDGPDAPLWSSFDATLLRAADELHRESSISDATWSALAEHYDEHQLIEVCMVIGQYHLWPSRSTRSESRGSRGYGLSVTDGSGARRLG